MPENSIAKKIIKATKLNHISMKELALRAELSHETVLNIVNEKKTARISTLKRIADVLNIDLDYLLDIKNNLPEGTPGEIIKKYRLKMGLSQNGLAKLCNLHKSTIKDYENDTIKGTSHTLDSIYKIIGYKME